MPELQRLRADHAAAVLAFERTNRAYFATFVSDRGDAFFDNFTELYQALLVEQETGSCVFHVLVGPDGRVRGRFDLADLKDGTAELGYRVAQDRPAAAWPRPPFASCAGWRRRSTGCGLSGRRLLMTTWPPRGCS